jgi:CDP-glucose 4,6-dehydratase
MTSRLEAFYRDRRVLVTGHTGFKGAWLSLWLHQLGARVSGFALPPDSGRPSLFDEADVRATMASHMGDLRDLEAIARTMTEEEPEVVFHLAARSLVRPSYRDPLDTWSTNVMGTAHLLEAIRRQPSVRAVVVVTSDKCYDNREWGYAYRENDALGGADPYSASKGAQEMVTASWRSSFFRTDASEPAGLATARAGNVVGGGDWAEDRLVPDLVAALAAGRPTLIRNPAAVRPWQHVLEPLSGYLWLARQLHARPSEFASAWNFGPDATGATPVGDLADRMVGEWGSGSWATPETVPDHEPHEAKLLRLDCTKAITRLGWRPVYDLGRTVEETVRWYRERSASDTFDAREATLTGVSRYEAEARDIGVPWALPEEPSHRASELG